MAKRVPLLNALNPTSLLKGTGVWTFQKLSSLHPNASFGPEEGRNIQAGRSSKLCAMRRVVHLRRILVPAGAVLALAAGLVFLGAASAQSSTDKAHGGKKPLPIKPDATATARNHRLILKDGSYQLVRQYTMAGDRVKYLSLERGEWEEMPADLVDWDATAKWERDHAAPTGDETSTGDASPGMKEAEEVDKEASEERALEKAKMPEVAPGLELPDQDSVFVLDTYQGTQALVELLPNDLDVDTKPHKGLRTLNPLAMSKMRLELNGQHAKVHLHVNDPTIYVSLGVVDDKESVLSHAITVNTGRANATNPKRGAYSDKSGFALIRLDERRALRFVGSVNVSPTGDITQSENVVPTKIDVMPGKHWLRIQPQQKLEIGEYALVEIISPSDINESLWDFSVNPATGDNPGSIGPLLVKPTPR